MKLVLDACVIYPTVMREILLGTAARGIFAPVWSARIIEEWLRAAEKIGPEGRAIATAEAAVMRDRFPQAEVAVTEEAGMWLPDPNDIHVLAAAVAANADGIVTANTRDFPMRALSVHHLDRWHPDAFLSGLAGDEAVIAEVVADVVAKASRISGQSQRVRALLKRAGMPRLGKLLG